MEATETTEAKTINGMSLTCEKRIVPTGSRCQRPVGHKGMCHPRAANA